MHKIHHGVMFAMKHYPESYVIIVFIGVVKGTCIRVDYRFCLYVLYLVCGIPQNKAMDALMLTFLCLSLQALDTTL